MIFRILEHCYLELVGPHCYTTEKLGRDAGEIVGLPTIAVVATGTVDEIIAARPDVVPVASRANLPLRAFAGSFEMSR
jgi:4-hydroxy-tetrahydrodipicolinate reductase